MSTTKAKRAKTLLESGLRQVQQGRLEQARLSCEEALRLVPRHPDALHLLGIIALQNADHATAVELLQQATAIRPDHSDYQANLAHAYCRLNRLPEALVAFERAAGLSPDDPELQIGVGNCLAMLGKPDQAERVFRRLVERHPQYPLAWFSLAKALDDQERYDEACGMYARVTQLAPQFAEAYNNLGVALNRLGRFEEAEQAIRACLACSPDFFQAYVNLAIVLNALHRHDEAEAVCRELLMRAPRQESARATLGRALVRQGRWREALQYFETAIQEDPGNTYLLGYFGDALARTGRTREALDVLDRALAIDSTPFLHFVRAITLLSTGRIYEGAEEYTACQERGVDAKPRPDSAVIADLPRELTGREVALVGEQGPGDEIFFLRYAPLLKARGCHISYFGHPRIIEILMRCALFDHVSPRTGSYGSTDQMLIMVGDLPHLIGQSPTTPCPARRISHHNHAGDSTFSANLPLSLRVYWPELPPPLPLDPLRDRAASVAEQLRRLGPPPYLGLTWRAGTEPQELRGQAWGLFKEIPLESLATVLHNVDGTLVSLQRRPRAGENEKLGALVGRPVHDFSAVNEDLEEMLALLAAIDEYIGVSNTNMHLRAAVGRTARVLVPCPAEWRWMNSGRSSPWFPGFSIYRQTLDGDWRPALARLRQDLLAKFGARR